MGATYPPTSPETIGCASVLLSVPGIKKQINELMLFSVIGFGLAEIHIYSYDLSNP